MNDTSQAGRWQADAREFGLHVRQGGWRLGLLVARNVEPGNGHGGDHTSEDWEQRRDRAVALGAKVSASAFAQAAGTGKDRVMRYFEAWERAAGEGIVPHAAGLAPDAEPDLDVEVLPDWSGFYTSGVGLHVAGTRQEALRRQAEADGVGPSKVVDVASNPRAMAAAIKADPGTARAAAEALGSPERTAEAAKAALADPVVAETVLAEPGVAAKVVSTALTGVLADPARRREVIEALPAEMRPGQVRRTAVQAVAAAEGVDAETARREFAGDVSDVQRALEDAAMDKAVTADEQAALAERLAAAKVTSRRVARENRERAAADKPAMVLMIEGELGKAREGLTAALSHARQAGGQDLPEVFRTRIQRTLDDITALVTLMRAALGDASTQVDWDAGLARLAGEK